MSEIELVILDIDGCIFPKDTKETDLSVLYILNRYNYLSQLISNLPPITLCSGRPQPYVDLLLKLIRGYVPALFEWGGGMYIPSTYNFIYSNIFTSEIRNCKQAIQSILQVELVEKHNVTLQPGKEVTITLYPPPQMSIQDLSSQVITLLKSINLAKQYIIHVTKNRIDLLPQGLDKGVGVRWLSKVIDTDTSKMLGIGDDNTDLNFLASVGISGCPRNATDDVKQLVNYVSPFENSKGVLDILETFIGKTIESDNSLDTIRTLF